MLRFLVAVDGSAHAGRAVDRLLKQLGFYKERPEIHLLNVQLPLPGDVTMFIPPRQIEKFHQKEGLKALASARAKLDGANVPYVFHIRVGDPASVIANYANEQSCDQIVMGTRGMGSVAGLVFGSVATKVVHSIRGAGAVSAGCMIKTSRTHCATNKYAINPIPSSATSTFRNLGSTRLCLRE